MAAAAKGQNLEVAIVIGGPTIDKISALVGVTTDTDDFEVLGAFYGAPAKMIKALPGIEWVIGEIIAREKLVDSGLSAL